MKKRGKKIKKQLIASSSAKKIILISLRYLISLILVFSLPLIYRIFTPLTVYPVTWLLKLFFSSVSLSQNMVNGENIHMLIINLKTFIQLIPACIAGSAYLLLMILNLTVSMNIKKRIYSIGTSVVIILLLNILRITIFSFLVYYNFAFFDFTHKLFWYFLSTVFVVLIWFLVVKIYPIKEIPVYSDVKYLMKDIKKK